VLTPAGENRWTADVTTRKLLKLQVRSTTVSPGCTYMLAIEGPDLSTTENGSEEASTASPAPATYGGATEGSNPDNGRNAYPPRRRIRRPQHTQKHTQGLRQKMRACPVLLRLPARYQWETQTPCTTTIGRSLLRTKPLFHATSLQQAEPQCLHFTPLFRLHF
jgi:hypothetical protein